MEKFEQFAAKFGAHLFAAKQGVSEEKEKRKRPVANGVEIINGEKKLILIDKEYSVTITTRSFFQLTKEGVLMLYVSKGEKNKLGQIVSETVVTEETVSDKEILTALEDELEQVYARRENVVYGDAVVEGKKPLADVMTNPIEGAENLTI